MFKIVARSQLSALGSSQCLCQILGFYSEGVKSASLPILSNSLHIMTSQEGVKTASLPFVSNSMHIMTPDLSQQCITSFVHPALLNNE